MLLNDNADAGADVRLIVEFKNFPAVRRGDEELMSVQVNRMVIHRAQIADADSHAAVF